MSERKVVLALNAGSSSLKISVFVLGASLLRESVGIVERVGSDDATIVLRRGNAPREQHVASVHDHAEALAALLPLLGLGGEVKAVSHRVVHGGPRHDGPVFVDDALVNELREIAPLAPAHVPAAISLIEAARVRFADAAHVACFDTAFHHAMPRVAKTLAIPAHYAAEGVRRYGFHGISYAYLMGELTRIAPGEAAGRVLLAHLGAGASMAAVRGGAPVDTTMGFTPTSGIMMGTRCGDIDPGVLLYLMRNHGMSVEQIDALVNRESGLRGISGMGNDMRELLEAEARGVQPASDAIELFCYRARCAIGALAAAMGGVGTLVFSGGIGENSPDIRARISRELEHLGIEIDDAQNKIHAPIISRAGASCVVRVLRTDEESMLAREACLLMARRDAQLMKGS